MSRRGTERRHAVDHIDDEVVAIEVVEHDHVEGRGRRAFLLVSADVDVGVIGAPVRQTMNQPGVAVVREYHGPVFRENLVELRIGQTVRMLVRRLEPHEVNHVHHPDRELREMRADQVRGGEGLERRHVAGACKHDVRLAALVCARPIPDAEATRAVGDRLVHRQVVEGRLLARDDHVDVVAAAQAVVGD